MTTWIPWFGSGWNSRYTRCPLLVVLGISVWFSCCVQAEDPNSLDRFQPQSINFANGRGGTIEESPSRVFPEYEGYGYRRDSTRNDEASCAAFEMRLEGGWPRASLKEGGGLPCYPANNWLRQRAIEKCIEESGPFYKDDLIPVFGTLYRVTSINSNLTDDLQGASIHLSKIAPTEWPAGVTLDPYAYAITPGGALSIQGTPTLEKRAITPSMKLKYDGISKSFSLTMVHDRVTMSSPILGTISDDRRTWREDNVPIEADALIGMTVGRDNQLFRVVSIVHPDRDNHLPGWVEFRRLWPQVTPYGTDVKSP